MEYTVLVFLFAACAKAVIVQPAGCGCALEPFGCWPNTCPAISPMPLSPILECGIYPAVEECRVMDVLGLGYPYGYGSGCGCGLALPDCLPMSPLAPVLGCPKYLRQIPIPPPFL